MMNKLIVLAVVVLMVNFVLVESNSCNRLNDCPCGQVCTKRGGNRRCENGDKNCSCRNGCMVHDIYLENGENKMVYGNRCSCEAPYKVATCSKGAWQGAPSGIGLPTNRNCRF